MSGRFSAGASIRPPGVRFRPGESCRSIVGPVVSLRGPSAVALSPLDKTEGHPTAAFVGFDVEIVAEPADRRKLQIFTADRPPADRQTAAADEDKFIRHRFALTHACPRIAEICLKDAGLDRLARLVVKNKQVGIAAVFYE